QSIPPPARSPEMLLPLLRLARPQLSPPRDCDSHPSRGQGAVRLYRSSLARFHLKPLRADLPKNSEHTRQFVASPFPLGRFATEYVAMNRPYNFRISSKNRSTSSTVL